jgi:hypothetical protein
MKIESLMKIDQAKGIQIKSCTTSVTPAIDRDLIDFDVLRAHVRQRSICAVRRQRIQEIIVTMMALVLGSIIGWALMR